MKLKIKRAWAVWLLVPVLFSCSTYNKSMNGYYDAMRSQDYEKAKHSLEKNKLINKDRNAVLFNLEMGRVLRLQGDYAGSNQYLNRADDMMEANRKNFADLALGNIINPMHSTYLGEDFEKFMVHYYKALNYSALGLSEDAVVEARRITLTADAQRDKFNDKNSRYSKDAFALNLQGMIYESAGDINNAFISYRNAAEAYNNSGGQYYGVQMPALLKNDLVRTSGMMGFTSDLQQYEKVFNISYPEPQAFAPDSNQTIGELVLFIEEGQAPVKQEKDFVLTAGSNGIGSFNYVDANGLNSDFNFNYNSYGISGEKLSSLRAYRVALPQYVVQYNNRKNISVQGNGNTYLPILAEDLNSIAVNTMKERFVKEMANALARQITKKLVEKGTEAATTAIAKSNDKEDKSADEKEKEEKKKKQEENAKQAGQVAGFLVNLVNTATEKADTRNWQSLPAYISYVRVPLHAGENNVEVNAGGKIIQLKVQGAKGLQMMGVNAD